MNLINQAEQFVKTGIAIIPVGFKDKRPNFHCLPEIDGKHSWEPYKTRLPEPAELQFWFSQPTNYGVLSGWQNLVVLDFDDMQEYTTWLFWSGKIGGVADYVSRNAYRVSTSRGVHVYIRLPHREKNRKAGKIDIKGDGYVLGPGSIHPSGAEYRAMRDGLNFPLVEALSDVLPVALLAPANTQQTTAATSWTSRPCAQQAPGASLVKKIKGQMRIEDFFPAVRPSGKSWLLTICPLHDDHNPSFWINLDLQICGCFAGCTSKPLDVINLYARIHGLSNTEAIRAMGASM